jgi:DNA-binding NtrC family response regulator
LYYRYYSIKSKATWFYDFVFNLDEADMAKKHRILLIDDSEPTIAGLEAYLCGKYHILTALNGRDGIRIFEINEKRIHLVLTDLILPDLAGSDLVSFIKNSTPEKPVIGMTGWEYDSEGFEFKLKADLILKKPFEMEELDLALEKLLSEIHTKKIRSRATPKKTQVITPDFIEHITKSIFM